MSNNDIISYSNRVPLQRMHGHIQSRLMMRQRAEPWKQQRGQTEDGGLEVAWKKLVGEGSGFHGFVSTC